MSEPCTAGKRFDRIEEKIDKLIELQIAQVEIRGELNDHEKRISRIENMPTKAFVFGCALLGAIYTIINIFGG